MTTVRRVALAWVSVVMAIALVSGLPIVAVPIDTPPDPGTATEGSVNAALALDLVSRLRGTTPALSLVVLFLGAERGDGSA